jgi:hypothetical protein
MCASPHLTDARQSPSAEKKRAACAEQRQQDNDRHAVHTFQKSFGKKVSACITLFNINFSRHSIRKNDI